MKEAALRAFLRQVRADCPDTLILEKEPMSRHCSFRIGGPCDAMLLPSSAEEIARICALLAAAGEAPFLMGNGTNLLITDGDFRRVVIRLGDRFARTEVRGTVLTAQAGITLAQLAVTAAKNGLAGLEFAHGIPGSLGGAVIMNAGAYGGEIKDVVVSVRYLDADGEPRETEAPDFSYRRSRFSDSGELVLGAALRLLPGDPAAIHARMMELWARRSASQPLDRPSAGSTFKRPATGYAAAMIEAAGLKGATVGGAQVSEKHAGFVINTGDATFADVTARMARIRETVYAETGILLEPEVKII